MRRQALVVGINTYPKLGIVDQHSHPLKLTTPVRDAEAIARLLELYGGFEVNRLPFGLDEWQFDPNGLVKQKELETAITNLFAAKENIPDTALLFFTGIGFRREIQPDKFEGFLATSDTKSEGSKGKPALGVSIQWLRRKLKESRVPQQIVWLVCGHSGELFKFPEDNEDKPGRDRCWIVSSGAEAPLDSDAADRSPIVKAIIQGLNPKLSNSRDWITSHTLKEFIETRPDKDFTVIGNSVKKPIVKITDKPIILTGDRGVPDSIYSYSSSIEILLKQLWSLTSDWFSGNVAENFIFEHEPLTIARHFRESLTNARIKDEVDKYQEKIQQALGFTFPEHWWNEESVIYLHQSLKHLCGSHFLGQDNFRRSRHISVGAAYLLALMAHRLAWPNMDIEFLTQNVDWRNLSAAQSPLFHRQDVDTAQSSAIALCQLFFHLFQQRVSTETSETSQVSEVFFEQKGRVLKIVFKWNASEPAEGETESLAKKVSALAKNIYTPKPVGNTREAIISLWMNLLISDKGFLSPCSIYMQDKTLNLVAISV